MENPLRATTLEDIANKFSGTRIRVSAKFKERISKQLEIINYLDVTKDDFKPFSVEGLNKEIEITVSDDPRPVIRFSSSLIANKTKVPPIDYLPSLYLTESNQIYDNIIGILDIIQDYYKPKLKNLGNVKVSKLELQSVTKNNSNLIGHYEITSQEISVNEFIDYIDQGIRNKKPGEIFKHTTEALIALLEHEDYTELSNIYKLYKMIHTTIYKLFAIDTYLLKKKPDILELSPEDILYDELEEIHKFVFSDFRNIDKFYQAIKQNQTQISVPLTENTH